MQIKVKFITSPTVFLYHYPKLIANRGFSVMLNFMILKFRSVFIPLCLLFSNVVFSASLPDLKTYNFSPTQNKILAGTSTENFPNDYGCNGTTNITDQIGQLMLVALRYEYGGGCWTDGRYNNSNYNVEMGVVTDGQIRFDAYKIYEPQRKFTDFLGSKHGIFYKFPTKENYTVYSFSNNNILKLLEIPAADIDTSKFIKINGITVSEIVGSTTYLFVPSQQRASVFTELATGIEGALIKRNALMNVLKYRYSTNGTPFDTALDFNFGPSSHENVYSFTRQFFVVQNNSTQQLGIVWQDKTNASIQLNWLGMDLRSTNAISLPNTNNEILGAATFDNSGNIYYLTIQKGTGVTNDIARTATLYKVTTNGQKVLQQPLDTSKDGLNIVTFNNYDAALTYSNNTLGLILGRQMHKTPDGLNHQGAIAVVFDTNTLETIKNHGQTSGHSLEGSVLTTNSNGQFLGIDVGDNYPRGVHLHEFDDTAIKSRVVYTFKTAHGTTSQNPAGKSFPEYTEISTQNQKYYRWSNDNKMYTEIGGVVEGQNSYSIVFSGESSPDGRALDNARTGNYLNDPRNIGLVQVVKNFPRAENGSSNMVTDDLVLTSGISEEGGFYTFQGDWSKQRNKGVVWLTHYQNKETENVSRLKTLSLGNGNVLLLWEKWTPDAYVNTYVMLITENGTVLSEPLELGTMVRLNRRDDARIIGNKVYLVAGDKNDKKLELIVLEFTSSSPPNNFSLNITKTGNGTISSNPIGINCGTDCNETYPENTDVTLVATPETGFNFGGWTGDCNGSNSTVVLKINSAKTCKASFTAIPPPVTNNYVLTTTKTGNGTISSNPIGINCGTDCNETYPENTDVTLVATPETGFNFSSWTGDCNGSNSTVVLKINSAKTCKASFTATAQYSISSEVIASGGYHSCAIKSDDKITCWGQNGFGQATPPVGDTFLQVSSGLYHSCGLKTDNTVVCWGESHYGQNKSPNGTFKQLSSGMDHNCAIKRDDETVICWGSNHVGESTPPVGKFKQVSAGKGAYSCGIREDNTAVCWGYQHSIIPTTENYKQIMAGLHTCALKTNNDPVCWGANDAGQATPPANEKFIELGVGERHSCGLRLDGKISCWGANDFSQLVVPTGIFSQISVGYNHNCAIKLYDNSIVCWGKLSDSPSPQHTTTKQSDKSTLIMPSYLRVFDWIERDFATMFSSTNNQKMDIMPFKVKYYPLTEIYLGYNIQDDWFYGYSLTLWGEKITPLMSISGLLPILEKAGF
ncbi:MAG: hypothetical protein RIT27_1691 [Pseudomonadota bacterium]